MQIAVDLHSHSGYAGGVGDIALSDICQTMSYKGIDIFGTGDCIFPKRTEELIKELKYNHNQLYKLHKDDKQLFLLQTEVILTLSLPDYKNKIVAHHILLFPDFEAINKVQLLFNKWKQKNTIGRPFIVNQSQAELEDRLFALQNIDKYLEIIPAHIMTPDGLMGSKNMLHSMSEFYGNFLTNIHAVETGLSSDPLILSELSEINELAMISSSDCHSAALNRVGREYTILDSTDYSYKSIIEAIRNRKISLTAEFDPREGRYYHTGHRAGKGIHDTEVYYTDNTPQDLICPVCKKKLTIGVTDRCKQLRKSTPKTIQKFVHLIPLIDVIAYAMNLKSVSNKKVLDNYYQIVKEFGTEINLWQEAKDNIINRLTGKTEERILQAILAVKNQEFTYNPAGFDGQYGHLIINI